MLPTPESSRENKAREGSPTDSETTVSRLSAYNKRVPETVAKEGVPKGTVISFTMSSRDSTIYNPSLIRDDVAGCTNSSIMITTTVPNDKSNMIVTTSHPGTWTRKIDVYVPANYVKGTEVPFIVLGDGGSSAWKDMNVVLDNLIHERRVPPMVSIQIGNGGPERDQRSLAVLKLDLEQVAGAEVLDRDHRAHMAALAIDGGKADQVGVVIFAFLERRQRGAVHFD